MKREIVIEHLVEAAEITIEFKCDKCGREESLGRVNDAEEAAEWFYDQGWRATEDDVICAKCRAKK